MIAGRVLVAGRELLVLTHAVDRYVERVKPHLSKVEARRELGRLLPFGEVVAERPVWANERGQDAWLLLGDGIAFPVIGSRLVTCLTRGSVGAEVRVARREWRQQKQEKRRTSIYGPVQRAARQRRRDARARVE